MITDQLLIDYKRCQRRAYLNIHGDKKLSDPEKDFRVKLKQEANRHIQNTLLQFYPNYVQVPTHLSQSGKIEATKELMTKGVDYIYQGLLRRDDYAKPLVGMPHLLIKQPGESCFGDWQYFPVTIQLGRRPKPEYKLIAAFYAYLLIHLQQNQPQKAKIILRRQNEYRVNLNLWLHRLQQNLAHLLTSINSSENPEIFISRQRCNLCQWYTHCYSIAQTEKHLSLVPGVTPSRYQQLKNLGIDNIPSLASVSPQQLTKKIHPSIANQLQKQAFSLVMNQAFSIDNQGYWSQKLPLSPIELYFDIEAEPERELDYLLGVLVVNRETNTEKFYALLAENPEAEKLVWQEFLNLVNTYPQAPIYHYSEYEVETVKRLAKLYQTSWPQSQAILDRLIDLHEYVVNSVIFPVESYSLKSLANWLGFHWRNPGVSGDQSVYWYDQWLKKQDRQLLELIVEYNEDDCKATKHLKDWLVEFIG